MVFYLIKVLFEFLFYIVLISRPEKRNETSGVNDKGLPVTEKETMELPELYVECKYLPNIKQSIRIDNKTVFEKVYEIDGDVFNEKPLTNENVRQEFEIRILKDDAVTSKDTDDKDMHISIQKTQFGIIIDSNIFVTVNQWNTITGDQGKCIVCNTPVDLPGDHIELETHKDNLQKYEPLEEYEGFMRKIGDSYYCAVCNALFNTTEIDKHYGSKEHEDNVLLSTNRASDILYDIDLDTDNRSDTINFDHNRSLDACTASSRNISSNVINNVNDNENNSDFSSSQQFKLSYASIAKTPAVTPKYIDIVFAGKKIQVEFDSWHMIVSPRENDFYCMLCVDFYDIDLKAKHCIDRTHLEKLSKCENVDKYKDTFVRKLGDRYYHCGKCNKLQLVNEFENHIELVHLKKSEYNIIKLVNINNDKQTNKNNELNSVKPVTYNESSKNESKLIIPTPVMILSTYYTFVYHFHHQLRVSLISYNMVYKRPTDYYCFNCDYATHDFAMRHHINELSHVKKMAATPFEPSLGVNLIRLFNNSAHCTICNIQFNISFINAHIYDQMHRILLTQALNIKPNNIQTQLTHQFNMKMNQNAIESIYTNHMKIDDKQVTNADTNGSNKNENENEHEHEHENEKETCEIESYNGDYVYLKNKHVYTKVSYNSYNGLLSVGDGSSYCFVCSKIVFGTLNEHIESTEHLVRLEKLKFIDKYDKHLLRQVDSKYHCCNCNVLFTNSQLTTHLTWQPLQDTKVDKKTRKSEVKLGIKKITIDTIKETLVTVEKESEIEVLIRIDVQSNNKLDLKKTNKIIVHNDKALKVSWDAWQSVTKKKDSYHCYMCQKDLKSYEIFNHIYDSKHVHRIERTFDRKYLPDLLRKIDDNSLNCVSCDMVISSKNHILLKHIQGKKHINTTSTLHVDYPNLPESNKNIFKV